MQHENQELEGMVPPPSCLEDKHSTLLQKLKLLFPPLRLGRGAETSKLSHVIKSNFIGPLTR